MSPRIQRQGPVPTHVLKAGRVNAPSLIQNGHAEAASLTLGKPVTAGNTLMLVASSELSVANIGTVTSAGAGWTKVSSVTFAGEKGCSLDVWIATNVPGGTTKVEVTKSPAEQMTWEVIEWAGELELDKATTVTGAAVAEPQTTTCETVEGSLLLKSVSTAVCEKLVVGWGVVGTGEIIAGEFIPVGATITKIETAKEEVKISKAAAKSAVGLGVRFGFAGPIKAPSQSFAAGDLVLVNYSGKVTQILETVASIKPEPKAMLELTGFNSFGLDCYYLNPATPVKVELTLKEPVTEASHYSLQVLSFKVSTGVAGLNAAGVLAGTLNTPSGKLDPTFPTVIPSFVTVGPTIWQNIISVNEPKIEPPAGSLQYRFEQSGTSLRLRGTLTVKPGQEITKGEVVFNVPTALTRPAVACTMDVGFGTPRVEATGSFAAGAEVITGLTKAQVEQLAVGDAVNGISIAFGTTVTELKPATGEVKISLATEAERTATTLVFLPVSITVVKALIALLGSVRLPAATVVKAGEMIFVDGTYPVI